MADKEPICGIIMPISASDEHTEAHWTGVKDILSQAIKDAGCKPQPVWESGAFDIIQERILKNIFDNEIVVCDISTRNPNVMLEWGMRLTTKKPTIVVAEKGTKLPFDTGIIHTEFYEPSLEWSAAQRFIGRLAQLIRSTLEAHKAGDYRPYLEAFKFETVEPATVTVPADQRLEARFDQMERQLGDIFQQMRINILPTSPKIGDLARVLLNNEAVIDGKQIPRSFINAVEIDKPYSQNSFQEGDRVYHDKFGIGQVTLVDGQKVTAYFDSVGEKRVMASFLQSYPL